jgi:hypothetical protein
MKIPGLQAAYNNDKELLERLIRIYASARGIPLANFELGVLLYYIRYGHSKNTRKMISEDTNKSMKYITVIDHKLKTKGFLSDSKQNQRKKFLSKDMESFKKAFIEDKKRDYLLRFTKVDI